MKSTNDHTVPQSYLRRFAEKRRGTGHFIVATRVRDLANPFETNVRNIAAVNGFYWGTTLDGVPHHDMDRLLGKIENAALPVFAAMLDDHLYALPRRWPLTDSERVQLSWWVAAQVLRTTRQRRRVDHLLKTSTDTDALPPIGSISASEPHLRYIADQLSVLAAVVNARPWGLGFSDVCLPTSDVPVVILNDHDADDQLMAATYWDVVLPLDPHRFLLLPGIGSQDDPRTRDDHLLKMDGGTGLFLAQVILDAADTHLFHHPQHPPLAVSKGPSDGPRLPTPWAVDGPTEGPGYALDYAPLPPGFGVERRWLADHPLPRSPAVSSDQIPDQG
jgi:hypothetical protein